MSFIVWLLVPTHHPFLWAYIQQSPIPPVPNLQHYSLSSKSITALKYSSVDSTLTTLPWNDFLQSVGNQRVKAYLVTSFKLEWNQTTSCCRTSNVLQCTSPFNIISMIGSRCRCSIGPNWWQIVAVIWWLSLYPCIALVLFWWQGFRYIARRWNLQTEAHSHWQYVKWIYLMIPRKGCKFSVHEVSSKYNKTDEYYTKLSLHTWLRFRSCLKDCSSYSPSPYLVIMTDDRSAGRHSNG